MTVFRALAATLLCALLAIGAPGSVSAQDSQAPDRSATGGAQTLEDIMARQRGEQVDDEFRRNAIGDPDSAAGMADQLGTLGGASDPELWRQLRFGTADVTSTARTPGATLLIQDTGMWWQEFRATTLKVWSAYAMAGIIGLLVLFYLFRGRIRIDGEKTGQTIQRFNSIERFAHWLLAGSFIVLGITGLLVLFGRIAIIPLIGHEAFAVIAEASKWIHNSVSWAFMLSIVMVFILWIAHNIPNRVDLAWIAKGGGIFVKGSHPPAKKFNAGQKLIFWSVILLGGSVSASGLSLLFPFELPMFAATFEKLNQFGIPQAIGLGELQTVLAPHEEMMFAQLWHTIVAVVMMVIIIAHIYIGSVGMEGAYDAMGTGQVEKQWAKEHHSIWYEEVTGEKVEHHHPPDSKATPAE